MTENDHESQIDNRIGTERQPLVSEKTTSTISEYGVNDASFRNERGEGDTDGTKSDSIYTDMKETVVLAFPIFLTMFSWVAMKTTDSALLGHVSADALAASALSDLWTMCTFVFIQGRVLSILCGNAIGAGNPKLAGIYLQVSYYVLSWVLVFVIICWYCTERVWLMFGSDPKIASMAGYYARVLAWSLPGQMIYTQLSQFFQSQRIMHPEVNAAAIAMLANLIFGLYFVLGQPLEGLNGSSFTGFGFTACPIVTACMTYLQLFIVTYFYMYRQRLHEPCWDGWSFEAITKDRIKSFIDLYIPAAFGTGSDFVRAGVIGAVAAKFGNIEVGVFNSSYRIMWIVLIIVNALSSAAGIKMTLRLGKLDA
jgi:multidrug resistance protein, MATE family